MRIDLGVYGGRGIPSTYSGYETFLSALLPSLANRGHRVTMYCRLGEVPKGVKSYRGVRLVTLPHLPTKQASTITHGALAGTISRLRRHDVVLVVNVANVIWSAVGHFTRQPVLLNTDGIEWERGKWGAGGRKFFEISAQLSRHCTTGLISDCAEMKRIYLSKFGAESSVIPYCYDAIPQLSAESLKSHLRRTGLLPRSYFLIAGRHNPENNLVTVARSYAEAPAQVRATPLVVLGEANYQSPVTRELAQLSSLTDGSIRMLGHISDRAVYASLVTHAALYIHGHSVGGINPSLLEAMGTGAAITAYDTPFNREALGGDGWYWSCGEALLEQLVAAGEKGPASTAAIRSAAAARARSLFGLSRITDAYEELLIKTVEHGVGGAPVATGTIWDA